MDATAPYSDDSTVTYGGSLPGGEGRAAFAMHRFERRAIPVLISVPHAGRDYPADLTARLRFPADTKPRLEDRFVDIVAQEVSAQTQAPLIVATAPRAMIDLNRSPDDVDWAMVASGSRRSGGGGGRLAAGRRARSGLGLVPRRLPGIGELWNQRLRLGDLRCRIEQVHGPYHAAIRQQLERLRDRWGAALLLDIHSMPPLPDDEDAGPGAQFVLGDRFAGSCDAGLAALTLRQIANDGYRIAHNRPYAGGYVLDRHGAPARGISAMQLEICRATYLDPALDRIGDGVPAIAACIAGLVARLAERVAQGPSAFAVAAE